MDTGVLNIIFMVLAAFVLGGAAIFGYFQYSKDRNVEKIRIIIYSAIDAIFQLYDAKEDLNKLIEAATQLTIEYIKQSDLNDTDKQFWTEDRIRRFVTPAITELYNRLQKNENVKDVMLTLASKDK